MDLIIGSLVEERRNPNPPRDRLSHYRIYSRGLILGRIEGTAMTCGERAHNVRVLKVKKSERTIIKPGRTYWMLERDINPYKSNKKCIVKFSV